MTDYAAMMRRHWEQWLPQRLREVPEPEAFFTELGREVGQEVDALALELEGPDRPDESYLDRVGRMVAARRTAEEILLAEFALPDPGETDDDGLTPDAGSLPVVVAPSDPGWAEIVDEEDQAQRTLRRGPSGR